MGTIKKESVVRKIESNTFVRGVMITASVLAVMVAGCAMQPAAETRVDPAVYKKAIDSPIRTAADREADATRKPLQFLEFVQVRPGDKALDMAAGAGNTAELVALVVGPSGTAYAQTSKDNPKLNERLAAHPDANLKAIVRSFEDPYPEDGPKLDVVTLNMNYHDIAYLPVDRAKMNKHIFEALKPGGHFIVIDHSAKKGEGITVAKTLHRIEESTVKDEIKQAGFVLVGESDYLRNPADPRDKSFYDMKDMPSDKFALRFVRP
jgi:predicted methyltransferase